MAAAIEYPIILYNFKTLVRLQLYFRQAYKNIAPKRHLRFITRSPCEKQFVKSLRHLYRRLSHPSDVFIKCNKNNYYIY